LGNDLQEVCQRSVRVSLPLWITGQGAEMEWQAAGHAE
jgi:hypothetical protein